MARPKSEYANSSSPRDYVGTVDAAAILGVSVSTIQKMVARGSLKAWRTGGGHRRIALVDLRQIAMGAGLDERLPEQRGDRPTVAPDANAPMRILLVENNKVVVKSIEKQLARLAGRVDLTVSSDAADALLKIVEQTPELLVTDLAMEPFDGFHLLRVLRGSKSQKNLPVIVVTGMSDTEIAAKGGLDERVTVYRKPVPVDRLLGFVDAMLQARILGSLPK